MSAPLLLALAAAPGVLALVLALMLLRRPPPAPAAAGPAQPGQPARMSVTPEEAQARLASQKVEPRLTRMETEVAELRNAVGALQDGVRELADRLAGPRPAGMDAVAYRDPVRGEAGGTGDRQRLDYLDHGTHMIDLGSAEPGGRGVDLDGGQVVLSRSLESVATLVGGADGRPARLYLNESIEIDHMAFDRWKEYFDFEGGVAYRRYRTTQPALVEWNETTARGRLARKGSARQL
jgi:hypothetical protein